VNENKILKNDIYKLAKNNYELFNKSKILKKYLPEINDIKNKNINIISGNPNEYVQTLNLLSENYDKMESDVRSSLSKLKEDEFIIYKKIENYENVGNAIIYNKSQILNYIYVEIDYSLIDLFFHYSHYYMPSLSKEIVMEYIQNKTILPGLLLAMYASAYMFKPNPDLEKSKRYCRIAYDIIIENYYSPNIQIIQAFTIISNCSNIHNFIILKFKLYKTYTYIYIFQKLI